MEGRTERCYLIVAILTKLLYVIPIETINVIARSVPHNVIARSESIYVIARSEATWQSLQDDVKAKRS